MNLHGLTPFIHSLVHTLSYYKTFTKCLYMWYTVLGFGEVEMNENLIPLQIDFKIL